MKTIKAIAIALFLGSTAVGITYADPIPQYNAHETNENTVHAYYLENGELKNIRIKLQRRYVKAYWNGYEWVMVNKKMEKNEFKGKVDENASDATQFLAKLPNAVDIDKIRVFFDPDEN